MSTHQDFNARMLESARSFVRPAAAKTNLDLQLAMQAHLWNAKADQCRRDHGWYLLPNYIELAINRAWDDCGAEFMAIAASAAPTLEQAA